MVADAPAPADLDRPAKAALLSLFNETVIVGARRLPVLLAFHASAASLCRMLTEDGKELVLPDGLPVPPEEGDASEADGV